MKVLAFGPKDFDKIESYWHKLEVGNDMTAFQLYDWYKNLNNLYFKEHMKHLIVEYVYVVAFDDNDNPKMIAPMMVIKAGLYYKKAGFKRGFYMIGRNGYTDYLNFIYDEFSEQALNAIFDFLQAKYKMSYFRLEQVLERTKFCEYLLANYDCVKEGMYCAALTLPESFEEYKKLLSKSTRQNIRTALNRQEKDGVNLTHKIVYDIDEELKTKLMDVREERLEKKRKANAKRWRFSAKVYYAVMGFLDRMFSAKQDVIRENCNPWCFLIKNGDEIAGFFWGIRHIEKKEFYVILAGVEEKYAWYSPSVSHLYKYIEELYESGTQKETIKVFDFTRGGEDYKEKMGGAQRECVVLKIQF